MKKTYLIIILCALGLSAYSQTCKDSLTKFSFDCTFGKLIIKVPCNYIKANYWNYIEGGIWTIKYADSSSISILCGFDANLSNSDNKPGLFYKKATIKGYEFVYDDVPKSKLYIFDKAFGLLAQEIK